MQNGPILSKTQLSTPSQIAKNLNKSNKMTLKEMLSPKIWFFGWILMCEARHRSPEGGR